MAGENKILSPPAYPCDCLDIATSRHYFIYEGFFLALLWRLLTSFIALFYDAYRKQRLSINNNCWMSISNCFYHGGCFITLFYDAYRKQRLPINNNCWMSISNNCCHWWLFGSKSLVSSDFSICSSHPAQLHDQETVSVGSDWLTSSRKWIRPVVQR